ncbi:MAG: aspartate aminotransferase family protein [Polyangiaceae bacterium]
MNDSQPKQQTARVLTEIPGPKSRALRAREDEWLAPGTQGYAISSGIAIESGRGSAVTDVDGNQYLDLIGGIGVNALGHSHPVWARAVEEQAKLASVGSFTSKSRVDLLEKVSAHAPTGMRRLQLYSSGAEAVESAIRLAKSYTGKHEVVSFWGGFHGKTLGALSLMGSTFKEHLGPLPGGSYQIPYADCYRCPLKSSYPGCGLACVELGKKHLKMQSSGAIAAVIVEPMQGTAGNIIPPKDFLPAVRDLAKEMGALLIADEMITGFGRTGTYWGVEHSAVRPDIMTLGKAFGGGFPLSGLLTSHEIARSKPWSLPSGSSSSYGGNPLAAAAGAASLAIIDDEKLVENSKRVGGYFLEQLKVFEEKYPFVGVVRGSGLFLGMELVKDKSTKEPLARPVTQRLFDEAVKRGLLSMLYAPSFRIQPALTIDEGTAKNAIAILEEVFDWAKQNKICE